jgi:hypothetical protein
MKGAGSREAAGTGGGCYEKQTVYGRFIMQATSRAATGHRGLTARGVLRSTGDSLTWPCIS